MLLNNHSWGHEENVFAAVGFVFCMLFQMLYTSYITVVVV